MSWTAAIPLVTKLVNFVLKAWKRFKRKRDYAKRQKQAKKIAENPARAMSKHFPGNDDKLRADDSGDKSKSDAAETGKADDNSA